MDTLTVFESTQLMDLAGFSIGETQADWTDFCSFLESWIGPAEAGAGQLAVPEAWKSGLGRLRWSGMVEPAHAELAFESLKAPERLRSFFEFARDYAARPHPDDLAARVVLATEAVRRVQSALNLPAITFITRNANRTVLHDFAEVLRLQTTSQIEVCPIQEVNKPTLRTTPSGDFMWSASAPERLKGMILRWMTKPQSRVVISASEQSTLAVEARLVLAALKPRVLAQESISLDSQRSDPMTRSLLWLSRMRSATEIPAARRWQICKRMVTCAQTLDLASKETAEVWLDAEGLSLSERAVLFRQLPPRTNNTQSSLCFCSRGLVPPFHRKTLFITLDDSLDTELEPLLTRSDVHTLASAGFEIDDSPVVLHHSRSIRFSPAKGRPVSRKPKELMEGPLTTRDSFFVAAKRTFSATQFETYRTCPARYFYRYELQLHPEASTFRRLPLLFGQSAHRLLERTFSDQHTRRVPLAPAAHIDAVLGELTASPTPRPGELGVLSSQLETICRKLPEIESQLASLFDHTLTPTYFEYPFEFAFAGALFCGKIDRIDRLSDGSLVLIDYKTGASRFSPDHIIKGSHFQTPLYLLAAQKHFETPIAGVLFYDLRGFEVKRGLIRSTFLAQGAAKRLTRGHAVTDERFSAILETSEQLLRSLITEIRSGNFRPNPSRDSCANCDYATQCRHSLALEEA